MKHIAFDLKKEMQKKSLTLRELSEATGIHYTSLSNWSRAKNVPLYLKSAFPLIAKEIQNHKKNSSEPLTSLYENKLIGIMPLKKILDPVKTALSVSAKPWTDLNQPPETFPFLAADANLNVPVFITTYGYNAAIWNQLTSSYIHSKHLTEKAGIPAETLSKWMSSCSFPYPDYLEFFAEILSLRPLTKEELKAWNYPCTETSSLKNEASSENNPEDTASDSIQKYSPESETRSGQSMQYDSIYRKEKALEELIEELANTKETSAIQTDSLQLSNPSSSQSLIEDKSTNPCTPESTKRFLSASSGQSTSIKEENTPADSISAHQETGHDNPNKITPSSFHAKENLIPNILEEMHRQKIDLNKLHKLTKKSSNTLKGWLYENNPISIANVFLIAEALKTPIWHLYGTSKEEFRSWLDEEYPAVQYTLIGQSYDYFPRERRTLNQDKAALEHDLEIFRSFIQNLIVKEEIPIQTIAKTCDVLPSEISQNWISESCTLNETGLQKYRHKLYEFSLTWKEKDKTQNNQSDSRDLKDPDTLKIPSQDSSLLPQWTTARIISDSFASLQNACEPVFEMEPSSLKNLLIHHESVHPDESDIQNSEFFIHTNQQSTETEIQNSSKMNLSGNKNFRMNHPSSFEPYQSSNIPQTNILKPSKDSASFQHDSEPVNMNLRSFPVLEKHETKSGFQSPKISHDSPHLSDGFTKTPKNSNSAQCSGKEFHTPDTWKPELDKASLALKIGFQIMEDPETTDFLEFWTSCSKREKDELKTVKKLLLLNRKIQEENDE